VAQTVEVIPARDVDISTTRYESLPTVLQAIFIILTIGGLGVAVFYLFGFNIAGNVLLDVGYYYLLIGVFLTTTFLILPGRKKDKKRIRGYDLLAAAFIFGTTFYFFLNAWEIGWVGWNPPNTLQFTLALILCLLVLEGGRRMAGFPYLIICVIIGLYPLFASSMPGLLFGMGYPLDHMIGSYAFGTESLLGLPSKVMGNIILGFLLFAGLLIASGAGDFFLNLAYSLLGRYRGGPAKVAVVASGFFGSMSGSAISNVVATGSITIPAMKKIGYPPYYAGAIEACASTGGQFMPPIMGAVAFVAAMILNMSYADIIVAAALPAILYYFGLLMQADAFAAKTGIKGLPPEDVPSLKKTLKKGWPFLTVFVFLLWGLIYMRWEAMTPFYASALMVLLSFTSRETMLTPKRLIKALVTIGKVITQTMAIILPIGIIVGALTFTGTAGAFTAGLVSVGGGNLVLVLLMGIVACYIMGMAGLIIPAYIFLAITLAPALVQISGLNVLAVHLLIIYYAMLSLITPPVCLGAFVGATIAGAPPMKTGWQAMRLGTVIYFIPIFFVFNPALVLQGSSYLESLYLFTLCLLGIVFVAAGLEGYLLKVGQLNMWQRITLFISGLLIGFPSWETTIVGTGLALFVLAITMIIKRKRWQKHQLTSA